MSRLVAPRPPRSPWQLLYGAAHRWRRRWYQPRAVRLPRPVVSIGNLHWGGAGKTPLVAAVAAHLRDSGLAVVVLSRGYGGRGRGVRVVSRGDGPLLGPLVAGDEPVLLAGELPGVAVVVGPDRARAGRHALERLEPPPDLFVLDDGFSHLALARDCDLLAFPSSDPWAGGRLAPGGRLREPLAAVARADAVLLTGEPERDGGRQLASALRGFGFAGPGFACPVVAGPARLVDGRALPAGSAVVAVCGIARPERFLASARAAGYEVAASLAFPDHHPYKEASLTRIATAYATAETVSAGRPAAVLATGKDRVKLQGRLDLPLAELPVRAEPEPGFWSWLDHRLASLVAGSKP